jgi:hypothetical protein
MLRMKQEKDKFLTVIRSILLRHPFFVDAASHKWACSAISSFPLDDWLVFGSSVVFVTIHSKEAPGLAVCSFVGPIGGSSSSRVKPRGPQKAAGQQTD